MWAPLEQAIARSNDRKLALVGDPTPTYIEGGANVTRTVRLMLIGTDIPGDDMQEIMVNLTVGVLEAIEDRGTPPAHAISGNVLDAFLIGWWAREAASDAP